MSAESRIKGWVVDVLAEPESRSVLAMIVAKIVHRLWRGFPSA